MEERYIITEPVKPDVQWTPPGLVRPKIDPNSAKVGDDGRVVFVFPEKFTVPEDWQRLLNGDRRILFERDIIEIRIRPTGSQKADDVEMKWSVKAFTEDYIEF